MKVWVLITGEYEDKILRGVFSTKEKAMAAWQPDRGASTDTYQWIEQDGSIDFDADCNHRATIQCHDFDEDSNLGAKVDKFDSYVKRGR